MSIEEFKNCEILLLAAYIYSEIIIIICIGEREMSKIVSIVILGCLILLTACSEDPKTETDIDKTPPSQDSLGVDKPDPLGNINQLVVKDDNWKQIVGDKTQFALGEIKFESESEDFINYTQSYGTFPAIDGSTVLIPMAAEFVWQFTNLSDSLYYEPISFGEAATTSETLGFLSFSTTPKAYDRIINGGTTNGSILKEVGSKLESRSFDEKRPDIVIATKPSAEELAMASAAGIELIIKPICYDSFVFITHKDNPVNSLTVKQIQDIYSGKITNWKEVGGWDLPIVAYQREKNSGSQTAMEEWVMEGIPMIDARTTEIWGMAALVDVVADYQNSNMSLGYTYKYYIDRLYKSPDIKIIEVAGVMPSDDNVRNGSYAFIAPYNAVIRSTDINETGGRFMDWILSNEGQLCISQAGYVSIR
jgi:phosphate transport system substrate-binding protein